MIALLLRQGQKTKMEAVGSDDALPDPQAPEVAAAIQQLGVDKVGRSGRGLVW